ncbi:winged helix-turn-helix transcriptional regulator [Nonomuraea endophytica]|uniref:winged helix-turn-helix transcriptional regulator n=1 Tax=Nonomuraea endophytica TaxID=714136 RepID=UPI0016134E7E
MRNSLRDSRQTQPGRIPPFRVVSSPAIASSGLCWPPRVRYTLTERGHALAPVMQALWEWGSTTAALNHEGVTTRPHRGHGATGPPVGRPLGGAHGHRRALGRSPARWRSWTCSQPFSPPPSPSSSSPPWYDSTGAGGAPSPW